MGYNVVGIINSLSSLILVLLAAFIGVSYWIDRIQLSKLASMKEVAKRTHVQFCEEFGYTSNTPVSAQTAREIIQALADGHEPPMAYLRSTDHIFNKDKTHAKP